MFIFSVPTAMAVPFKAVFLYVSFAPDAATARSHTLSTPTVFCTNSDDEKSPLVSLSSSAVKVRSGREYLPQKSVIPFSFFYISIVATALSAFISR